MQKQSLADDKTAVPRVQSIDEVEKLAGALRRIDAGKTVLENPNDCLSCVRTTNRCFHATHAYTGVPCAAYSEYDARYLQEGVLSIIINDNLITYNHLRYML